MENAKMPRYLARKMQQKKLEVRELKKSGKADYYRDWAYSLRVPTRSFIGAIAKPGINIIAEFKRASPSRGEIRPGANPAEIAQIYQKYGARAISVLTDKDFEGRIEDLRRVHDACDLPVLRKDFIIDDVQLYEARANGADAVLLISAMLEKKKLHDLIYIADTLGLDCLVESHNQAELANAIAADARILGFNNRNLNVLPRSFVDLHVSLRLLNRIPIAEKALASYHNVVVESGIKTYEDIKRFQGTPAHTFLVGTAPMESPDIGAKIRELLGDKE